jgi:hypothetical protein
MSARETPSCRRRKSSTFLDSHRRGFDEALRECARRRERGHAGRSDCSRKRRRFSLLMDPHEPAAKVFAYHAAFPPVHLPSPRAMPS